MEKNNSKSTLNVYKIEEKPVAYTEISESKKGPVYNNVNCPDCDARLDVPDDIEKGEILSCPGCGLELEAKNVDRKNCKVDLQELTIEGEDWGE